MMREPLSSSGRTEQLWSHCEPGGADPSWEMRSVEGLSSSPSGLSLGPTPSHSAPPLSPQNTSWRAAGVEQAVSSEPKHTDLEASSPCQHLCCGSVQFDLCQVLSLLG